MTYRRIEIVRYQIDAYTYEIDKYAKESNVSSELLRIILELEMINRGRLIERFLEKMLVTCFPKYAIKRDISVGLAQIRISTAKSILRRNPKSFLKSMFNDEVSIHLCAQHLRQLIDDYLSPDYDFDFTEDTTYAENDKNGQVSFYIASKYLCGENAVRRKYVYVYATIICSYAYNILDGYRNYMIP